MKKTFSPPPLSEARLSKKRCGIKALLLIALVAFSIMPSAGQTMPQSVYGGIVYGKLHGGYRDMFVLTSWVMISGTVNDAQNLTNITVVGASKISVMMYSSYGGGTREANSIISDNYAPAVSPGAKDVNWFYTYNLTGYGIYTDGYSGGGWFNYVAPPSAGYETT